MQLMKRGYVLYRSAVMEVEKWGLIWEIPWKYNRQNMDKQKVDSFLQPQKEVEPCHHPDFSPMRHILDLSHPRLYNIINLYCFKLLSLW